MIQTNHYPDDSAIAKLPPQGNKRFGDILASISYALTLNNYTMAADDFHHGVKRMPFVEALDRKHIQVNKPWRIDFIPFDIDRWGGAIAPEEADLPTATYTMRNPDNGHAHLLYELITPVYRGGRSRTAPQRFYNDVATGMTMQMDADPVYSGLFIKTPGHIAWETTYTGTKYDLNELREYLTVDPREAKTAMKAVKSATVSGSRTLTLFNLLRKWSYQQVAKHKATGSRTSFEAAVMTKAQAFTRYEIRTTFPNKPILPYNEYKAVAASVTRWTWDSYNGSKGRMTKRKFSKLQSNRAKRSAQKRWGDNITLKATAKAMKAGGRISNQAIADELGVHRNTVTAWVKEKCIIL